MKIWFLLLLPCIALASSIPPTPFPVFLRAGFSSVLEFEEVPIRVVLGDTQHFQVEKLDHSLIVKTVAPYAASNMFVYFKDREPRLFVLTASEDAEPTYYKKFESLKLPTSEARPRSPQSFSPGRREMRILSSKFDQKKDYLAVEIDIAADSKEPIRPNWSLVRLTSNYKAIAPNKLWSERQEIQRDSRVRARFIFAKPNVPRNLKGVSLVVPIQGSATPFSQPVQGVK